MDCKSTNHKTNLLELFPVLINDESKKGSLEITPSCFIKEMTCSTNERLERLIKSSKLSMGKIFKVVPNIIIFQNFKPGDVHSVTVSLMNVNELPKPLGIQMEPSIYFTIKHSSENIWTKVAPGMAYTLEVTFIAEDFSDYKHSITFLTEGDSINLDLIAIGPRPLLDIPDTITLPTTAINVQTEKTILVRNLGDVPAFFTLIAQPPFSIKPQRDAIKPNKCKKLIVFCQPKILGDITKTITLLYDSGERLQISLRILSEEARITLSKNVIKFDNTFLDLSTKLTTVLKNLSNHNLRYCWKIFKYVEDETKDRMSLFDKFKNLKDYELGRDTKIGYYEIADEETNQVVYNRIFDDEEDEIENDDYLVFNSSNFIIEPKSGDLWSGTSVNFEIFFRPKFVGDFKETAYLQIDGLSSRKVVSLEGICDGPKIILNVEEIDAQNIYIKALHKYEVVLTNIGLIPGTISYLHEPTKFGGKFHCSDNLIYLKPKGRASTFLDFSSENKGKFVEEIRFIIQESKEILKLTMMGNIVCPLLFFEVAEVNFGDVPLGVPVTIEVNLKNPSQVPIEFVATVSEDGLKTSYTLQEYSDLNQKVPLSSNPKEFVCDPYFGEVEPYSKLPIKITLTANVVGAKEANLILFMWGSKYNNRFLPMRFKSHIPHVICTTSKIDLKSMFITQPYERTLVIQNKNKFNGFFTIFTEVLDGGPLEIFTDINQAFIEAYEKVEVKITVFSNSLCEFSGSVNVQVFGSNSMDEVCLIKGDTRGPCIDIFIDKVNLGNVPTLEILEKEVIINNDSPIRANLTIETTGNSILPIDKYMTIPPEESKVLILKFYGKRAGQFKVTLSIDVENGDSESFTITGKFFGGCILCEPRLDPVFNAGILLTELLHTFPVKITNEGNVTHFMEWSTLKQIKSFKESHKPTGCFSVIPQQCELEPEQSMVIEIQGSSKYPCVITETFYLHAKPAGINEILPYLTFEISADFQDPIVKISKNFLQFRIDFSPEEIIKLVDDEIFLKNNTELPLKIFINIQEPFYLLQEEELFTHSEFEIDYKEKRMIKIRFQPEILEKKCFTAQGCLSMRYMNHPKLDKIRLVGYVNFPQINFIPRKIELPGIPLNQKTYSLVKIENISPLNVRYKFNWDAEKFQCQIGHVETASLNMIGGASCVFSQNTLQSSVLLKDCISDFKETASIKEQNDEIEAFDEFYTLRQFLYPLVAHEDDEENADKIYKTHSQFSYDPLHDVLDVIPCEGTLGPFQCQIISIGINPNQMEQIKAELQCEITGGEFEIIPITINSGVIRYSLESRLIDLKIIPANQIFVKEFPLKNICGVPFRYLLTTVQEWSEEFQAEPQWMNVTPPCGILQSSEIVNFSLKYFPGRVGFFKEKLKLEVGFEEPISLTIKGYAGFPQVYFNFPRPDLNSDYVNLLSYAAIGDILYTEHSKCDGFYPPKSIVDYLETDDWVVVEYKSCYPSVMDIEMAIERRIAIDHFLFQPKLIEIFYKNPTQTIPNLVLPPYEINFGYVIPDTVQDIHLKPIYYKPYTTKLHWAKLSGEAIHNGLQLQFRKNIDGPFLIFKPSSKKFNFQKNDEYKVKVSIYAMISGGATLEFIVTAKLLYPKIKVRNTFIDFGEIQCGYCCKRNIFFETEGNVKCSWKANLVNTLQKQNTDSFFILVTEGSFEENNIFELDIFFRPKIHGKFENKLVFTIELNPDVIPITLVGVGLIPEVKITESTINFKPTLPYSVKNFEKMKIRNNSIFPIEIIFPDFNSDLDFEQHVIRFLKKYYQTKSLLVPSRNVGENLSGELVETYQNILSELRECLMKKPKEESVRLSRKTGSSSKNVFEQQDSMQRDSGDDTQINVSFESITTDPIEGKNYQEIEQLLQNNLPIIKPYSSGFIRNLNQVIFDSKTQPTEALFDPSKMRDGLVIIFHGAPQTEFLSLANKTGQKLHLNVYGIDSLILEAILENQSLASIKMNEEIDKRMNQLDLKSDELIFSDNQDERDILEKKIYLILTTPKKIGGKSGIDATKNKSDKSSKSTKSSKPNKSQKSDKSSKESAQIPKLDLPEMFILEILQQKLLMLPPGFIIESLHSQFLPDPQKLYLNLLKFLGNIRYIQLIYLSLSYNDFLLRKQKENLEDTNPHIEINLRGDDIIKMNAEEYESLSREELKLFYQNVLEPRKIEMLKREEQRCQLISLKYNKQICQKKISTKSIVGVSHGSKIITKPEKKSKTKSRKSASRKSSKNSLDNMEILRPEDLEVCKELQLSEQLSWKLIFISENWNKKEIKLTKELPLKLPVLKDNKRKSNDEKKGDKKSSRASSKSSGSKKTDKSSKKSSEDNIIQEQKIKVKYLNSKEVLAMEERGVYCWIVNTTSVETHDVVIDNLQESEEFSESLNALKNQTPDFSENNTLYSVLTAMPEKQTRNISEVFTIYEALEPEDALKVSRIDIASTESNHTRDSFRSRVSKISTKEEIRSKRTSRASADASKLSKYKGKHSARGSTSTLTKNPASSVDLKVTEPIRYFKGRYIMNPKSEIVFDVYFTPKYCGDFSHTYKLYVISGSFNFSINLNGKADLPKIYTRPEMIFSKVLDTQNYKNIENCVYYKDQDIFSFGPIIAEEGNKENKCFSLEARFNIINQSYLPCEVSLNFEEEQSDYFSCIENDIILPPNNSQLYSVFAHPTLCGTFKNQLLICIKNNPKIETINLACIGVAIDVEVFPSEIHFERVLLGHSTKRSLVLKNNSIISLMWTFNDPENILNIFVPNCRRGVLNPMASLEIRFNFFASTSDDVMKKHLFIEFQDERCDKILAKKNIQFSANVVEYFVEYEEEIKLGDVKLSSELVHLYNINNKSKIDVKFRFEYFINKKENKSDEIIKKYFTIVPSEDIIPAYTSKEVKIIFTPLEITKFHETPIFKCNFLDYENENQFHSFILKISAKVIGSSFTICPPHEINFGNQLIQTEITKEIMIKNTGTYSFSYGILTFQNVKVMKEKKTKGKDKGKKQKGKKGNKSKNDTKKTPKDSKNSKSSSKKSKKSSSKKSIKVNMAKPTTLTQGVFSLTSSTGVIEPNSEAVIKVTCKPKKVGDFEEYVVVFISQTEGINSNGKKMLLRAKGCIPQIDFENYDDIFKEQFVVENLNEFVCPQQVGLHPVFIKESKQLYFNKSCLNIPNVVRIKIRNSGEVGALVTCKISEGGDVFSITPNSVLVDACKFVIFLITFKPIAIDKFYGIVEFELFMSPHKFNIKLCGEGYLPEIKVMKPCRNKSGKYCLNFNPQIIGSCESKELVFKNSGLISCKVLIGVQDDDQNSISLRPKEFPAVLHNFCNKEYLLQEFKHSLMMELNPNEECIVYVEFKACADTINNCSIRIFVVNNPYELIDIFVRTEGYKRDVIIDGLETVGTDNQETIEVSSSELNWPVEMIRPFYKLDFGNRFLNKLHKKCFKITNISEIDTYKFVFTKFDNLIFIPAVGHLKPLATKDVIATFFTKETIIHQEVLLELQICKIKYLEAEVELLSWDDRQNFTVWKSPAISPDASFISKQSNRQSAASTESAKLKTTTERIEPPIEEVEDSHKNLTIIFSIVADYCSYEFDITEIIIEDTLMFEKRKANFFIKNISNVDLLISWSLTVDDEHLKKSNEEKYNEEDLKEIRKLQRPRSTCPQKKQPFHLTGLEKFYDFPLRPKSSFNRSTISIAKSVSSNSSTHSDNMNTLIIPFTLDPLITTIPPKETQNFTVTFSPYEVYKYSVFAKATIPHLEPSFKQPIIPIQASSLLPLYHFNIETSDYLTRREGREICGETIDESTKVLEFEVLGTRIPLTKKFAILNPTGETFNYRWQKSKRDKNLSLFHCEKPSGTVTKGEMAEAIFTFIAEKKGSFEMVYNFFIEKYNLSTKFLFVGRARDPCIFFKQRNITLKPTILGAPSSHEVLLVNNEAEALKFKFSKASTFSEGRLHRIVVEPNKGIINGKTGFIMKLTFNPINTGEVTFNLECQIENMEKPLILVIHAKCFTVQSDVKYFDNIQTLTLREDETNIIKIPSMMVMKQEEIKFEVLNIGHVGFYFKWKTLDKFTEDMIKIEFPQKEGYLKVGSCVTTVVNLKTTKQITKRSFDVDLKVLYGATYHITFICSTCRSKFKLSFKEYNFGPCLVQKEKCLFYETILDVTNNDINPITVDVIEEELDFITVINRTTSILSKKSGKILFYFHPLEIQQYKAEYKILVNKQTQCIQLYGEGVPLEIELQNPKNKIIHLGAVNVGKSIKQQINVINKSKCSVTIFFGLYHHLPFFNTTTNLPKGEFEKPEIKPSDIMIKKKKEGKAKSKGRKEKPKKKKGGKSKSSSETSKQSKQSKKSKKSGKSSKSSGKSGKSKKSDKSGKSLIVTETQEEKQRRLVNSFIKITPQKWLKLQADQATEIIITYSPKERMTLFTDQIFYQVQDYLNPICMFKGSCIAADFCLDYDRVNFGTVIKGCQNGYLVKLFNRGDIGGKYKWYLPKRGDFKISPMSGYITPGMSVVFDTRYIPSHISCLTTITAQCTIDNFNKPLTLELIGTCINLPPPKEVVKFACPVREKQCKKITIKNPSGFDWNIVASLSGNFFTAPERIIVESKSSATFEVTYSPLSMTLPNKFHEGKLFLPLPEGQGFLFNFFGEASRPTPVAKIERTIPSKLNYTESLSLVNWLPYSQQFTVVNQIDQSNNPKKVPAVIYRLMGNQYVDLSPYEEKQYKWIIHALNEGKLSFKIKFRNEETKEYLEYDLNLNVTKCEPLDTIAMFTCARKTFEYRLKLENPLKDPAVFKINCPCPDLHFEKVLTVEPYTQAKLLLEYKPLLPAEEFRTTLEAVTTTMGTFPYILMLSAGPAKAEPAVYFEAQLGSKSPKTVYLNNPLGTKVEFTSKLESRDFIIENPVIIEAKTKGKIDIIFEPSELGGFQSKLILNSILLGEYIYPLIGTSERPKPQGPFEINDVSSSLPFKNPFLSSKTFYFKVEPAVFLLKQQAALIKQRETFLIQLNSRTFGNEKFPVVGKLIINCDDDDVNDLEWVMYLKKSMK